MSVVKKVVVPMELLWSLWALLGVVALLLVVTGVSVVRRERRRGSSGTGRGPHPRPRGPEE